ncbi:hypothetical protein F5887DRAFT_991120 [Amanita rubescens]|nr:hypothetical protein F5887DRAFT_991120 [Amanita rubescens]
MKDPASQIPRAVSPVPTEILEDPPVEDIIANLVARGIEIRDFASPEEVRQFTLKPVPEIFDPYRGVAEFEYRLGVKTFRRPVPGKTLRRLLVMGWVTQEEAAERCAPMDFEALETYDARVAVDVREGRGIYPWRSLKWTTVPTMQERKKLVVKYMWHFVALDRARKHLEALERKEQLSREQAEEEEQLAMKVLQRQELEKKGQAKMGVLPADWESLTLPKLFRATGEGSRKRSLSNAANQATGREAYDGNDKDLGDDAPGESKRARLTPQPSSSALPPSPSGDAHLFLPQSQEDYHLPPNAPAKQYPAPLSSYDPNIYPDAASIISSQSQQRGLPPTNNVVTPPGSPREGSHMQDSSSPSGLSRGLRGKLARTQTFTLI